MSWKTGGHTRAAESGSRVSPEKSSCANEVLGDESQLWGVCGWVQDCFKAGRIETQGLMEKGRRGTTARRRASKRS